MIRTAILALVFLCLPALPALSQKTSGGFSQGSIKIGYDSRTCDATLEGSLRYNSATSCTEYCDGAAWTCPGGYPVYGGAAAVSLSWNSSCSLSSNGLAECWGHGSYGGVGDGGGLDRYTPTTVDTSGVTGTAWTLITAALYSACGIRDDSTGWCWGHGLSGGLGDGSGTDKLVPVEIDDTSLSGTGWVVFDGGGGYNSYSHTCGIRDDGTAWCWGRGTKGQLGNGGTASATTPVAVDLTGVTGTAWVSINAGDQHTCGIRDDGSAWCWGWEYGGQLGDGLGGTGNQTTPVQVGTTGVSGTAWTQISASLDVHTCGLRDDGTAWCWGHCSGGCLGNGTTSDKLVPTQVTTPPLRTWTDISTGVFHTCGLMDDGTAWCWGQNDYGQLGDGNIGGSVTTPTEADNTWNISGTQWVDIEAGAWHSCGLRDDDTIWCWGANTAGALGRGSEAFAIKPVAQ